MKFYKQKAIEEARRQHMSNHQSQASIPKQVIETKEIYRTPGYNSRNSSPKTSGYGANYRQHKRLKGGYDNSSKTLQSTAIIDSRDYEAEGRKNAPTPDFSPDR